MAKIKKVIRDMPLRKAFIFCVSLALLGAVILSALTIWGCMAVRIWLLPESEQAVLSLNAEYADGSREEKMTIVLMKGEELPLLISTDDTDEEPMISYTFDEVQKSYRSLSPKRQVVYVAASAATVAMPMLYCVVGILLCAIWFYKYKLKEPLMVLEAATNHIARQDLDFVVSYESKDEFGKLCMSFEEMRVAMVRANKEMWDMLEERRKLQASIAHDLRNPIAIIKGYAEYLQINVPKGNLKPEQTLMIADNLAASASRLERYTDSVRSISKLEAMEIQRTSCLVPQFLNAAAEDMRILAGKTSVVLTVSNEVPEAEILLDRESYSRVLENILQNAFRYAKQEVHLSWKLDDGMLLTTIMDDGPGFPENVLKGQKQTVLSQDGEHMGMGLVISRILCQKHGGKLKISNTQDGAKVEFSVQVS